MLTNLTAVVTGSGIGIGRAIASRFAAEGASVVVVADIDETLGQETVKKIEAAGGRAVFQHVDCSDEASVKTCMDAAAAHGGGKIDVLCNNAVRFVFGHLKGKGRGSGTGTDKSISADDWKTVLETNVLGYARCIEHAVPHMLRNDLTSQVFTHDQGRGPSTINAGSRGAIVNIASVSSWIAQPEFVPYNCSKGAVIQLTRCTALDLAADKIRVNALCPGTIETPGSYAHMELLGLSLEEGRAEFASCNPMNRQAAPEEIASGALFLASDMSSFMTGAVQVMDGGQTI
jgi:NAD(P)-dependent dehydrogenase (short-subunit alcohol dehydrogenase family)